MEVSSVTKRRGRMSGASTKKHLGDPKHAVRATRTAGRQMRSRLLDAASRLFKERGLAAVSIADIAAAADAFPSQITYYFRTKEALFVEAACRDVLYVARAAEQHAGKQLSPPAYTRARRFWTIAIGVTLEGQAMGRSPDELAAEMLRLLCPQADAAPAAARLSVVRPGN